jgi:hypothetical protein
MPKLSSSKISRHLRFNVADVVPGKDALSDCGIDTRAPDLTKTLYHYRLRVAPEAPSSEKIAAAWTCYFEADARGVHLDQGDPPAPYLSPLKAIVNLIKFVMVWLVSVFCSVRF